MKLQYFAAILILISSAARAERVSVPEKFTCVDGKIRYQRLGKSVEEKSSYCFDAGRTHLVSKDCYEHKSSCYAWKSDKPVKAKVKLEGPMGSPGFKLCRSYGGEPLLLEFYDGKEWNPLDRCVFSEDGSFVSNGLLLRVGS